MEINARCIHPGSASGEILFTTEPISFWGCVDPQTGKISDKRHELFDKTVSGRILAFPFGKGSSTGSLMILELLRLNLAPQAIINIRTEPLLATGPIVGKHFYGKTFPIITIAETSFNQLKTGTSGQIEAAIPKAVLKIFE